MNDTEHIPVLLHEVLEGLAIDEGDAVVDATLGGGGYAEALCERIGSRGTLIGLDQDKNAVGRTQKRLTERPCAKYVYVANFRRLAGVLAEHGVRRVDKVVFDLGLSSDQLASSGRGFSFQNPDEPLMMTFAVSPDKHTLTAAHIVSTWEENDIANVLYGYGEERKARIIAKAIVQARSERPLATVGDLVQVIESVAPRRGKRHPATRTFQALRMAVNDELGALEEGLQGAWNILRRDGRLAVVAFHSIEDRAVKRFMQEHVIAQRGTRITKKPVRPTRTELQQNPRSRSARLRIIEKNE